jgi:hypothetical protein
MRGFDQEQGKMDEIPNGKVRALDFGRENWRFHKGRMGAFGVEIAVRESIHLCKVRRCKAVRSIEVNKFFPMVGLLILSMTVQAQAQGQNRNSTPVIAALNIIRSNAREASENAGVYQWVRVNREVDRIVARERALRREFGTTSEKAAAFQALQQAITQLRSGRLNHNIEQIQQASEQIIAQCEALLK